MPIARFVVFLGPLRQHRLSDREARPFAGADNRHLDATPHVRMAYHPAGDRARECFGRLVADHWPRARHARAAGPIGVDVVQMKGAAGDRFSSSAISATSSGTAGLSQPWAVWRASRAASETMRALVLPACRSWPTSASSAGSRQADVNARCSVGELDAAGRPVARRSSAGRVGVLRSLNVQGKRRRVTPQQQFGEFVQQRAAWIVAA